MRIRHDLVLVGGGHAHVQVLRRWAMDPVEGVRLTLVVDTPLAVYSGMVPGFVAGQYMARDLQIDVRPLAARAGARVVVAAAKGVDSARRRIELAGRPALAYDTASFDVGSTVAGLDVEGVREYALPTRPIGRFVERVEVLLERARRSERFHLVVVGAGAGGVELSFCFERRFAREGVANGAVTLLEAGNRVLPGYAAGMAARIGELSRERRIEIRTASPVARLESGAVLLQDGERLACDAVAWVTGAASLPLFRDSGLPTDERGFVRVRPTLQLQSDEALFACGDCAHLEPGLPKAGVYAVRSGPVLAENLRSRVAGGRLRSYRPQRDFLTLLNLGDGSAVGAKWGRAASGPALFRLKDWIDRRFVRRFQVLTPEGKRSPQFPEMPGMGPDDMPCGGCAAKVGDSVLRRALERLGVVRDDAVVLGLATPDDAAAVETPGGELVVASVDVFRAFTGDPWLVGRVAAANAGSDLWAKGVTPRFALAQVSIPEEDPERAEETLFQVLAGARACFDPEGVTLVGGHTTSGDELSVGFAVWGVAAPGERLLRLGGLSPGERLVLTKSLGTGVLFAADMRGLARGTWIEAAIHSMLRTNASAGRVARALGASACTDVSGFGMAGHLGEMLRASKASARILLDELPILPGARELMARGQRSSFHEQNARGRRSLHVDPGLASDASLELLFDPQTSGGLLFGVAAERVEEVVAALRAGGDAEAAAIGSVEAPRTDGALFEVGRA